MGYWEEKKKYEEQESEKEEKYFLRCTWCGKMIELSESVRCQGKHPIFSRKGRVICKICVKKCKHCERYFCLNHLKDHRCN
ncbi:hypothetical protein COU54_02395 [Candidatus Pacearchaeota archaeon CG10_big_fil_rev_8_21_14_0_10_31_24]|nr:MAG: hypothetical protein COU54_02395 [Candidatus Pacearchaeota archaeon CG10_big_fil_rev_8_21_14_0_10_31_24]